MRSRQLRSAAKVIVLAALALAHVEAFADKPAPPSDKAKRFSAAQVAFFEKDVLPILKANCFKCHGGSKVRGGLRLNSRETILKGGDTGPAIVPGKPQLGTLLPSLRYTGDTRMPPRGKLPDSIVADWPKRM